MSKLENYKSQNYIFMLQKIFSKVAHNVSKTMMIAIIAMCVTSAANAQIRVAVLDFQAGAGVVSSEVDGISDVLITYLGNDARFILVERTQVQRVLREQGFQHSNITDSDAVRLGRILNVNKVVLGRVTRISGHLNMDCRVVDVQTGRIIATAGDSWTPATFRSVLRDVAQNLSSGMVRFEQARVAEQRRIAEERRLEEERNRPYVLINGIRWARFNVGARGVFVSREEEHGNRYTWEEAQTACPQGWRLPTQLELQSLNSTGSIWTTRNSINGRLFGIAPNQIFLPAAGSSLSGFGGILSNVGNSGVYRSGTQHDEWNSWNLDFNSGYVWVHVISRFNGYSVRCVAEN